MITVIILILSIVLAVLSLVTITLLSVLVLLVFHFIANVIYHHKFVLELISICTVIDLCLVFHFSCQILPGYPSSPLSALLTPHGSLSPTTQGRYQVKPPLPFAPGGEVAGVITEVGEGCSR